jgi:hypothetical protein
VVSEKVALEEEVRENTAELQFGFLEGGTSRAVCRLEDEGVEVGGGRSCICDRLWSTVWFLGGKRRASEFKKWCPGQRRICLAVQGRGHSMIEEIKKLSSYSLIKYSFSN